MHLAFTPLLFIFILLHLSHESSSNHYDFTLSKCLEVVKVLLHAKIPRKKIYIERILTASRLGTKRFKLLIWFRLWASTAAAADSPLGVHWQLHGKPPKSDKSANNKAFGRILWVFFINIFQLYFEAATVYVHSFKKKRNFANIIIFLVQMKEPTKR